MNQNRFILRIANLQLSQIRPHGLTNSRTGGASPPATTKPKNPTSASSRSLQSNSGYPLSTKP